MNSMNNKTKKIAFLGGSFNPPHIAHKSIIEYLLKNFDYDKILLVPSYYTKHKIYNSIDSYEDRLNMLNLSLDVIKKTNDNIEVSNIEKALYDINKDFTYTYNVLKLLEEKNKKDNNSCEYYIIIGFDSIINIETWYNYKELIDEYKFIIFDRKEDIYDNKVENKKNNTNEKNKYLEELNKKYNLKYTYIDNCDLASISSSYIRNKFNEYYKNNDNGILLELENYLDKEVIHYILNKNLYKD